MDTDSYQLGMIEGVRLRALQDALYQFLARGEQRGDVGQGFAWRRPPGECVGHVALPCGWSIGGAIMAAAPCRCECRCLPACYSTSRPSVASLMMVVRWISRFTPGRVPVAQCMARQLSQSTMSPGSHLWK